MPSIEWVPGSYAMIGPVPIAAAAAPAGSTARTAGAVAGVSNHRRVTARTIVRQLNTGGTVTERMRVGFTEDFRVRLAEEDPVPRLYATFNLRGAASAYANGALGILAINQAEARVRGQITAQVLQDGAVVMDFGRPFRRTARSAAIADRRVRVYGDVEEQSVRVVPSALYRVQVIVDLLATADIGTPLRAFSTTEALADADLASGSAHGARVTCFLQ